MRSIELKRINKFNLDTLNNLLVEEYKFEPRFEGSEVFSDRNYLWAGDVRDENLNPRAWLSLGVEVTNEMADKRRDLVIKVYPRTLITEREKRYLTSLAINLRKECKGCDEVYTNLTQKIDLDTLKDRLCGFQF